MAWIRGFVDFPAGIQHAPEVLRHAGKSAGWLVDHARTVSRKTVSCRWWNHHAAAFHESVMVARAP